MHLLISVTVMSNVNNYRGISLQNCITKLFSAALNSRVVAHYEDKFAIQQFGFLVNHRTTDSIAIPFVLPLF
jgi:hypothetical protein